MRRILVTGANKGIGFAIAERILEEADTFVFLGSRSLERGLAAAEKLHQGKAGYAERIQVVEVDVSSTISVEKAARFVRKISEGDQLYGIVNNAGIGLGSRDLAAVLDVNCRGIYRICNAFIPLLAHSGRIVNITSGSGPMFLAKCSREQQAFFTSPTVTWGEIEGVMDKCEKIDGVSESFLSMGLADGSPYGLSKACANAITIHLAREYPQFIINACTPGYIATDLTLRSESERRKSLEELGMKSPREGADSTIFLLFGQPKGSGHYYGSDAKRSPLHYYRAPGTPEYCGEP